ncbi:MAG: DUF2326 domain-containing protein [Candidatus Tectomicrobia bacterium]|uniref:DUF2326 domain-containing protein n=1 Tax=Tectimicrobiota bacterium TaxID=2528274 RepID=A0A932HZA7_UNCTE|nr:DUF2326 domain-containing protein [Candidatus Tectomicrobia bacterium]
MIREIISDLGSFKPLRFREGLNIILADKTDKSTDRQSRNGAGKSSIIEIIHFLFGGEAGKGSIFRTQALQDHTFFIDFDLGDEKTTIGRSGQKPADIQILHGSTGKWPYQPRQNKKYSHPIISNVHWRETLGNITFGLDVHQEIGKSPFEPTFRQLFSYFVRRHSSGAFHEPQSQNSKQQSWDIQVALSFLLGLDWTIPRRFQELRIKERTIKELRKGIKEGGFVGFLEAAADIRTRVTLTEARVRRFQTALAEFRVVPEYSALEREANEITARIRSHSDDNTTDRALAAKLEEAFHQEDPPGVAQLGQVYKEAGVILPEKVTKRFEDVIKFHQAIIENRRAHLQSEIDQANRRIAGREREMAERETRRAQIMGILRSGGALEHYTKIQEELARSEGEAQSLRQSLMLAEDLENRQTSVAIERTQLLQRLQEDHHEQEETIRNAIIKFGELSSELYERAGNLVISTSEGGPRFEVKIEGARSRGITNMQIFCFDMMLMALNAERGLGPGFLVHDSHLFDGVDERQVANALQIGSEKAKEHNFQYIVTMNSDALPKEGFRHDFNVRDFVIEPQLTDETETGGLFGIRFG